MEKYITDMLYTLETTDDILICDRRSNDVTINLKKRTDYPVDQIYKIVKTSQTNNSVAIYPYGSDKFNECADSVLYISDASEVKLWNNGTCWQYDQETGYELAQKNSRDILYKTGYQDIQIDFVNLISASKNFQMKWFKDSLGALNVAFFDGKDVIRHVFEKEPEDDFIKWTRSELNNGTSITNNRIEGLKLTEITRVGTWVDTALPNVYTTQVGATFEGDVLGSEIWFNAYTDNRGGIWRFIIDNDLENPIDISIFATVATSSKKLVKVGLNPFESHNVKATFVGADPLNPPSGGTARGWARGDDANTDASARMLSGSFKSVLQNYDMLYYQSNRDFAFYSTYGGNSNFVPAHSGVGSAFKIDDPVYKIDDVVVDLTAIAEYNHLDCEKIEIIQHFYGRVNVTNVAEYWLNTIITKDGVITTKGKMKALVNYTVGGTSQAYNAMLPLVNGVTETAVTSQRAVKVTPKNNTTYRFADDLDESISVCGIDSTRKNLISAFSIDHIQKTSRQTESKERLDILWANMTSTSYMKIYNEAFSNVAVTTGYTHQWFTRHACAVIDNVYDTIISII